MYKKKVTAKDMVQELYTTKFRVKPSSNFAEEAQDDIFYITEVDETGKLCCVGRKPFKGSYAWIHLEDLIKV